MCALVCRRDRALSLNHHQVTLYMAIYVLKHHQCKTSARVFLVLICKKKGGDGAALFLSVFKDYFWSFFGAFIEQMEKETRERERERRMGFGP